jgi:hypothetical protein
MTAIALAIEVAHMGVIGNPEERKRSLRLSWATVESVPGPQERNRTSLEVSRG